MTTYTFTPSQPIDIHKAGIIHDYLEQNGIDVEGVSINVLPDKSIQYEVRANSDPTLLMDQFVPPIDTTAEARDALKNLQASLKARNATLPELNTAVLALMELNGF